MNRNLLALALSAIVLCLLAACGSSEPEATPTALAPTPTRTALALTPTAAVTRPPASVGICSPGAPPAYLKNVVLARDVQGAQFTPVGVTDTFSFDQETLHAVAVLEQAPANMTLRAVWYLVKADGYTPNHKIEAKEVAVPDGGTRNLDFSLKATTGTWPTGTYCVEIYAGGVLARSKTFTVKGGGTAAPANANPVKQVILARETKSDTFEPVNPATIFATNSPFIHAVVQIASAAPGTVFHARWYPPGQEPLDFQVRTDGTRWIDFRLTPTPDGFPAGDYKVEIYVNETLVDTKTFTVQ